MSKHDMDLIGHFEELRKRLIFTLGTFIVLFILSFIYVQDIYQWLVQDLEVKLAILGPAIFYGCIYCSPVSLPFQGRFQWPPIKFGCLFGQH